MIRKIVEFCLRHEECIRRAIVEKRLDSGKPPSTGGGGHCKISDPTAMQAINNMEKIACVEVEYGPMVAGHRRIMPLKKPMEWLKVAKWVQDYYRGKPQGDIIRMIYKESADREDVCNALNISKATYYVALNDIFTYAAGLARGLNIIR